MTNTCGSCSACCTVLGVEALRKPGHTPCLHQVGVGCAVYPQRPNACRAFVCEWLRADWHSDLRPDRIHGVPVLEGDSLVIHEALDHPGVASHALHREIVEVIARGSHVVVLTGEQAQVLAGPAKLRELEALVRAQEAK